MRDNKPMKSEPYTTKIDHRPAWLDMIPVKRYEHFTRFYKPTVSGGYHECYLNTDIDRYATKYKTRRS